MTVAEGSRLLCKEGEGREPRQSSAWRMTTSWVEFPALPVLVSVLEVLHWKPSGVHIKFCLFSRSRAQRKVCCTPRVWRAPLEMCAAGGWGPGTQLSASSTQPSSSLCSLLQVDIGMTPAGLPPRSLCCLRLFGDPSAGRKGCGSDAPASVSPGPPSV